MPAASIAIIYSVAQSRRRALIVPDNDAQLNDPAFQPVQGEGIVLVPMAMFTAKGFDPDAFLATHLGKSALSHRCAVVIGGLVQHFVCADPAIDSLAGTTLVQSDLAKEQDAWDGTRFTRRYAVVAPLGTTVSQIAMLAIVNPVSPVIGGTLIESQSLKAGDPVLAVSVGGIAT
jgi:hypothetical protein